MGHECDKNTLYKVWKSQWKPLWIIKKGGGGKGIRKSSREDEYDQNTLCTCVELSQWNSLYD
jgi:hypothetical protein